MMPGRPVFYPQGPPARDFDAEEKDIKVDIALNERLIDSMLRILPAFVTESGLQRMGLEGIEILLLNFRNALRNWMCTGLEENLADLQAHRANPAPMYQPPKPTPEQLIAAQMNVDRMEEALAAADNLGEKEKYAFGAAVALMRPMIEMQLDHARQHLEMIQSAMEAVDEPNSDLKETLTPPADIKVSNEPAPGEAADQE